MNKTLGKSMNPSPAVRYRSIENVNSPVARPLRHAPSLSNLSEEEEKRYWYNLCGYLTERGGEVDLPPKEWRLQDFKCLTSDDMLKIVILLLREICTGMEKQEVHHVVSLPEVPGLGNLTYDAGMDEVYHKVKVLFPEDDNLFNYSVLLMPALNPARTKAVLLYIMRFEEFVAQMRAEISKNCDEVLAENTEKIIIFKEVELLESDFHRAFDEREIGKHRLPVLNKELETAQHHRGQQLNKLADLEDALAQAKSVYKSMEEEIHDSNKKLMQAKLELTVLEQELVQDSSMIISNLDAVQKENQAEFTLRTNLNLYIAEDEQEIEEMKVIIANVKKVLKELTDSVTLSDKLRQLSSMQGADSEAFSQQQSVLRQKISQLHKQHSLKLSQVEKVKTSQEAKLQELSFQLESAEKEKSEIKKATAAVKRQIFEIQESVSEVLAKTDEASRVIEQHVNDCNVVLPDQIRIAMQNADALLEKISEHFCNYPVPNLNPAGSHK